MPRLIAAAGAHGASAGALVGAASRTAGVLLLFPTLLSIYMMFLSGHPEWRRVLVPVPLAALVLAALAVWLAWPMRTRNNVGP